MLPQQSTSSQSCTGGFSTYFCFCKHRGMLCESCTRGHKWGFPGGLGFYPQPRMHARSGDVSVFHHLSPSPPPPHAAQSTPGQRWGGSSSAMGGDVVGDGKGGLKHFAWLELSIAPSRAEEAPSSVLADVSPCQRSEI